ncbi:MAG: response regulator, partial [Deltaproteobacteria bacterium]
MEAIRTLIVDDEPLARRRIVQLLAKAPGFALHGECRNGAEAVAALSAPGPGPDVVFLDVQMP